MSDAVLLTLRVAAVATLAAAVPATLLGYWTARRDFPGKAVVSALLTLPLVAPPTAVGYLLLRAFAEDGPLGPRALGLDLGIVLTWKGAALAAAIMAFPIMFRTARVSFEGVPPRLESMARTLGHGRLRAFFSVTLPLASRGLLAAAILGFTRAVGEFGATVVLAGSIPGKTRTLASAIWAAEQAGREREAMALLGVALAVGFAAVFAADRLSGARARAQEAP